MLVSPHCRLEGEDTLINDYDKPTVPKEVSENLLLFKPLYDCIKTFDNYMAFVGASGKSVPGLEVSIIVKDTWYEQPTAPSSSGLPDEEDISDWEDHKDHMPSIGSKGPINVVPSDLKGTPRRNKLPWGVPLQFKREDEEFLSGPLLVKDNKVKVEAPYCQGPGTVSVKVDKSINHSEKLCRTGLRESFSVEFMLKLLLDRLVEVLKAKADSWDFRKETKFTVKWIKLIQLNAFRTSAFLSSVQVLLKGAVREEALNNLYGHPTAEETKKHLRHSHWASSKLFGPLPSQFLQYLSPHSNAQSKYLLYTEPKKLSTGSANFGQSFAAPVSYFKRQANSNWSNSVPKSAKTTITATKPQIVTPAEALSRNSSQVRGRGRFFRGSQSQRGSRGARKTRGRGRARSQYGRV